MLLEGRVAIVSGVGPGLGRHMALALAREGAAVVLGARTATYLEEVAAEIGSSGGRASACPTDVTDRAQCERLVSSALDSFGRVDCLVNNAFRPDPFVSFEDADLDDWRKVFEVNLFGSLQLAQVAVTPMKEQGGGSIVFVNSMIVRKVLPNQGGYACAKGALLTAAQVLARELGPYRIRVNSLVPGWLWGPSVQRYFEAVARRGPSVEEQYAAVAADISLGSIPTPEECARAVLFLASDLSIMVTGQAIDVNGGEVFH